MKHKTKKEPYLVCDSCGKRNKTVTECADPYAREINDEIIEMYLCDDCYADRAADI